MGYNGLGRFVFIEKSFRKFSFVVSTERGRDLDLQQMVQNTCCWEKDKKKKANKELERNGKMGLKRVWERKGARID